MTRGSVGRRAGRARSPTAAPRWSGTYGLATLLGGSLTIFDRTISGLNLTLFSVSGTFPLCLPGSLVCNGGPVVASK